MVIVREVINCWNLIGDTVYMMRPLQKYIGDRDDIGVVVADNLGGQAVKRFFQHTRVPVLYGGEHDPASVVFAECENEKRIDVGAAFRSGKHIANAYCDQLGVPWDGDRSVPMSWADGIAALPYLEDAILVAPFSVSGTTNKAIFDHELHPIIDEIEKCNLRPVIIDTVARSMSVSRRTIAFDTVEQFAATARGVAMVLCCDNGISHLASSLAVKTRVYWKNCVAENWIAPNWGRDTKLIRHVSEACEEIRLCAQDRTT